MDLTSDINTESYTDQVKVMSWKDVLNTPCMLTHLRRRHPSIQEQDGNAKKHHNNVSPLHSSNPWQQILTGLKKLQEQAM